MMKKIFLARTLKLAFAAVFGFALIHLHSGDVHASETAVIYKNAYCGCCESWAEHLRRSGFTVEVITLDDVSPLKTQLGIPEMLWSCHTARIGGYVVEGHVPAEDIKKLLAEKPDAVGISVPGMPIGSPGMEVPGQPADTYYSILFNKEGRATIYVRH